MIKGLLIGNPVEKSISHITHNQIFKEIGVAGLYAKKLICVERLEEEVKELKQMEYDFLAVTMPLKEKIIPFLDEVRSEMGSVNTIKVENGKWIGYNFDGIGCLNAIESVVQVKEKKVLVLGAGGAAKAAIYELLQRGAEVFVWNRTHEKALAIAKLFGIHAIKEVAQPFDVIIQATSVGMFFDEPLIDMEYVGYQTVVMEMVYNPRETAFVKKALEKGAHVVFGYEMFAELTFAQFNMILKNQVSKEIVAKTIKNFFIKN